MMSKKSEADSLQYYVENFLITPIKVMEMVYPEYDKFISHIFQSVPERTLRSLKNSEKWSKKTTIRMRSDIKDRTQCSEEEADNFFDDIEKRINEYYPQPWTCHIDYIKKGFGVYFPHSGNYLIDIFQRIESSISDAIEAFYSGDVRWIDRFEKMGLPSGIVPDAYWQAWDQIIRSKIKTQPGMIVQPSGRGKFFLKTSLYLLAAFEVSLMNSGFMQPGQVLWIHKRILYYNDKNILMEPIRIFFDLMLKNLGMKSNEQLAKELPALSVREQEKDVQSQLRQIKRWKSGENLPSWEYMRNFRDSFYPGDDHILLDYAIVRFLQELWRKCLSEIPILFCDNKEIISIFQEYPKWQKHHQEKFAEWSKAGNQQ